MILLAFLAARRRIGSDLDADPAAAQSILSRESRPSIVIEGPHDPRRRRELGQEEVGFQADFTTGRRTTVGRGSPALWSEGYQVRRSISSSRTLQLPEAARQRHPLAVGHSRGRRQAAARRRLSHWSTWVERAALKKLLAVIASRPKGGRPSDVRPTDEHERREDGLRRRALARLGASASHAALRRARRRLPDRLLQFKQTVLDPLSS
jgi:hypothetical protein